MVEHERVGEPRAQRHVVLKIDVVAAVGRLQAVVGVVLFLSGLAEGEGPAVLEEQIAVKSVVEHQSELPAGQFVDERGTEYRHSFKFIRFHRMTSEIYYMLNYRCAAEKSQFDSEGLKAFLQAAFLRGWI